MSTKRNDVQADLDVDQEVAGSFARPVRLRRSARVTTTRTRGNRRKAGLSRRKSNKIGGMHQRANKRTNW